MELYRIAEDTHISKLNGIGSSTYGGRYNGKGIAVLYLSESAALAAWEKAVHLDFANLPANLVLANIQIPDDWEVAAPEEFASYSPDFLGYEKLVGKEWVDDNKKPVLKVPSVVLPYSFNYLINVSNHEFLKSIKIIYKVPFTYDSRFTAL